MSHPLDPYIPASQSLVRHKARRLCRRGGFSRSDLPDLEQQLWLHLHTRVKAFDPMITSWETFASFILDNRCISLLRHHRAEKRSSQREDFSLNEPVRDGDGRVVDRHQTTPEAASTRQRLQDLERDIADLRERLPSELHRLIMDALGRGATVNALAGEFGVSRRSAERHVAEIRAHFEDADLREYL